MGIFKDNFGSIVGSGSSIIGSLLTNHANRKAQSREMDFARESYAQQRSDTLADRQHEENYNSPLQQAQRLRNAGMSPMDYMGEPVSTSTGDSGSINQPEAYRADNPLSEMMALGKHYDDLEFQRAQLQEQKRVNDSLIAKNEAETVKTAGDNYRAGRQNLRDEQRFDMEKEKFTHEVEALKLSNEQQEQILKHNEVMFPLVERAQKIETELKEETKDLVKQKLRSEIVLNEQKAKNLAQEYTLKGPDAVIAQLTTEMYGEDSGTISAMIMEQMHCDEAEARAAMVEAGIKAGVLTGEYGAGVQGLATASRQIGTAKGSDNGASRGLFGSIIRAAAKIK